MSYMLRLPEINAVTDREKLQQIKSYLYQMTQELNLALETVEKEREELVTNAASSASKAVQDATTPLKTFAAVKALIIKNADIVQAYYEAISTKLSGVYVAQGGFDEYTQNTQALIDANSQRITQNYTSQQTINSQIQKQLARVDNSAYIQSGLLDEVDGEEIYGVEVGQTTIITDDNGEKKEVFSKSARFTASSLEFYDSADSKNKVAWITNKQLFITDAEITGTLTVAGFTFQTTASGNFRLSLK